MYLQSPSEFQAKLPYSIQNFIFNCQPKFVAPLPWQAAEHTITLTSTIILIRNCLNPNCVLA